MAKASKKTELEDGLLNTMRIVGLPEPVRQHRFDLKRKWRFDFCWPDIHLAIEVQGGSFSGGAHVRPIGQHKDFEKLNTAQISGWVVLQFNTYSLKDLGLVISTIEDAHQKLSVKKYGHGTRHGEAGNRYGRLVVLDSRGERWRCQCDCGNIASIRRDHLKVSGTQSCGCLARELTSKAKTRHGMTGTNEYTIWASMKRRCNYPGSSSYEDYGGRGIKVCERWNASNGFDNFYADMGPRPSSNHSLERIDNSGNYEPENVRWATRSDQARNRRSTKWITFNGETLTQEGWAKKTGIGHGTLSWRLQRGWSIEDALTKPIRKTSLPKVPKA